MMRFSRAAKLTAGVVGAGTLGLMNQPERLSSQKMSPHWRNQERAGQNASMALYNMWAHAACFWISELFHPIMFAMPLALFIMGRHTGSFYESAKLLAPSKAIFRGIPTSPVRRLAVPALCLGAFTSTQVMSNKVILFFFANKVSIYCYSD